jgi:hypothetical protein
MRAAGSSASTVEASVGAWYMVLVSLGRQQSFYCMDERECVICLKAYERIGKLATRVCIFTCSRLLRTLTKPFRVETSFVCLPPAWRPSIPIQVLCRA